MGESTILKHYDPYRKTKTSYNRFTHAEVTAIDPVFKSIKKTCLGCEKTFLARSKFLYRCNTCLKDEGWDMWELTNNED